MIHAYHLIIGAFGYWLPNDPRGSWSEAVRKWELLQYGQAIKTLDRRSLSELTSEELIAREAARSALAYPPVRFTGEQARAVARGFAKVAQRNNYSIWACAILPEHTHLVIARHRYRIEQVVNLLKGAATRQLIAEGIHPLNGFTKNGRRPPMWAVHEWKVYLDSEAAIEAAIRYVDENPMREGKPGQRWAFVKPFIGLETGWITYH